MSTHLDYGESTRELRVGNFTQLHDFRPAGLQPYVVYHLRKGEMSCRERKLGILLRGDFSHPAVNDSLMK